MISVKNIHLNLARLLGDYITPEGVEFSNGNEDGIRYTYLMRRSAIEFALGNIIENLDDNKLSQFKASDDLTAVAYGVVGNCHFYRFSWNANYLKILGAQIQRGNEFYDLKFLDIDYIPSQSYLIGLGGVAVIGGSLYALFNRQIHNQNLSEIAGKVIYLKVDGMGESNVVLNLPRSFEEQIINIAYQNLITKEVVKK